MHRRDIRFVLEQFYDHLYWRLGFSRNWCVHIVQLQTSFINLHLLHWCPNALDSRHKSIPVYAIFLSIACSLLCRWCDSLKCIPSSWTCESEYQHLCKHGTNMRHSAAALHTRDQFCLMQFNLLCILFPNVSNAYRLFSKEKWYGLT